MAEGHPGDSFSLRRQIPRLLAIAGTVVLGGMVMAPVSGSAQEKGTVRVPCSGDGGGPAGIAAAVKTLNQDGGGNLFLTTGCVYEFTKSFAAGNATDKITTKISVIGDGAAVTRNSKDKFRFFEVAPGGDLSLLHIRLQGGQQSSGGALMIDQGATATVESDRITRNEAQPTGGGIYDEGTLDMEQTYLTHNSATPIRQKNQLSAFGAGLRITATGKATISTSEVTDNVLAPSLRPVLGGAGIFNNGQLTVRLSRITGNSINTGDENGSSAAGAGIGNTGTLTLNGTKVEDNSMSQPAGSSSTGSGVWNTGSFTSIDSTISGNTATGAGNVAEGAGVYAADGKVDLVDTRITKNKATGNFARGGGVGLSDTEHVDVTAKDSPITDNFPDNCFPVTEVPNCRNSAHRSRPKS